MSILPEFRTLKRSKKRINKQKSGTRIMKDGRTIRTGSQYTKFRLAFYELQLGLCQSCGRFTHLNADPLWDSSFHVHHKRGRGGGKRDDTAESCTGLCGACHRKVHNQ